MPGFVGRKIIFTWGGQQIDGVREKSAALNGEPIDVTADESDGWRELLAKSGLEITPASGLTDAAAKVVQLARGRS